MEVLILMGVIFIAFVLFSIVDEIYILIKQNKEHKKQLKAISNFYKNNKLGLVTNG